MTAGRQPNQYENTTARMQLTSKRLTRQRTTREQRKLGVPSIWTLLTNITIKHFKADFTFSFKSN